MTDSHKNPTLVRLHLKRSKTDPFRRGADVYLERSANDMCPVSSLFAYMAVRGTLSGPLFIFSDGCPLSRVRLVQELQRALSSAGLDCSGFTSHRFPNRCRHYCQGPWHRRLYHQRVGTVEKQGVRGINKVAC